VIAVTEVGPQIGIENHTKVQIGIGEEVGIAALIAQGTREKTIRQILKTTKLTIESITRSTDGIHHPTLTPTAIAPRKSPVRNQAKVRARKILPMMRKFIRKSTREANTIEKDR
jgi:hypothetical protein